MEEATVLEDEHATWFGFDVELAVEVAGVESRGSSAAWVLVEIKMQRVERNLLPVRSYVGAVLVR